MNIDSVGKVFEKVWMPHIFNFILKKRLCDSCMAKFIKKNKIKVMDKPDFRELCGICHKCHKPGIVYYIDD
jgi:hypothetical protein